MHILSTVIDENLIRKARFSLIKSKFSEKNWNLVYSKALNLIKWVTKILHNGDQNTIQ